MARLPLDTLEARLPRPWSTLCAIARWASVVLVLAVAADFGGGASAWIEIAQESTSDGVESEGSESESTSSDPLEVIAEARARVRSRRAGVDRPYHARVRAPIASIVARLASRALPARAAPVASGREILARHQRFLI